jgi:hypothetical protein
MDLKNRRDILVAANYWAEQDKQLPNVDEVRPDGLRVLCDGCCVSSSLRERARYVWQFATGN